MAGPILAVDTAGARCSAAVVDPGGRVLARRDPEIGRGHAERLMDVIAEVLAEAGLAYADLGRIAVSVGPGSFTGLRVGVAAARGLALALDVPAVGVSTLDALAEPHRAIGPVLAAIDARRGEVYAALYGPGGEALREPAAVAVAGLPAFLHGYERPRVFVGSAALLAVEALGTGDAAVLNSEGHVDAAAIARLALARPAGPAPRPLYLRGADAKPQGARMPERRPTASGSVLP